MVCKMNHEEIHGANYWLVWTIHSTYYLPHANQWWENESKKETLDNKGGSKSYKQLRGE